MLAPATWDSGLPIRLMGQFIKRLINGNFLLWPLGKFILNHAKTSCQIVLFISAKKCAYVIYGWSLMQV